MSNVSIFGKKWIDLVFEDRNQIYGAYQLRQENPRTTLLALFWGILFFAGFSSILIISSLWSNKNLVDNTPLFPDDYVIKVTNFTQPVEPKIEEPKTTQPNTTVNPIEPQINLLSHLVVTETPQAVDVPTNDEMEKIITPAIQGTINTIGIGTEPGNNTGNNNGTFTGGGNNGIINDPGISKSFELDKLPEFPGGINKFYNYVANNFEKPDLESGSIISVLVSFVVEKDGTLSNIKVLRKSGNGIDKEAIRVLSSMKTKWIPGIKNGKNVRTEFTLPIKVKIE